MCQRIKRRRVGGRVKLVPCSLSGEMERRLFFLLIFFRLPYQPVNANEEK